MAAPAGTALAPLSGVPSAEGVLYRARFVGDYAGVDKGENSFSLSTHAHNPHPSLEKAGAKGVSGSQDKAFGDNPGYCRTDGSIPNIGLEPTKSLTSGNISAGPYRAAAAFSAVSGSDPKGRLIAPNADLSVATAASEAPATFNPCGTASATKRPCIAGCHVENLPKQFPNVIAYVSASGSPIGYSIKTVLCGGAKFPVNVLHWATLNCRQITLACSFKFSCRTSSVALLAFAISVFWMVDMAESICQSAAAKKNSAATPFTTNSQPYFFTASGLPSLSKYTPIATANVENRSDKLQTARQDSSWSIDQLLRKSDIGLWFAMAVNAAIVLVLFWQN